MKFDVIYSLGKNCACSEYLKKHNLRLKARPFDWIVSANNYAPFECILDEFNLFSDFSYLKVISQYDNTLKVEHSKTKYLFLHDFFTNSSLSSQINPIHDKYQRRVVRFLQDLKSKKSVLLVWYGEDGTILDQKTVKKFVEKILAKYGTHIYFTFIMYSKTPYKDFANVSYLVMSEGNIKKRQEGFLQWDKYEIDPVFANISIRDNKYIPLLKIREIFYRLCAVFIFNKDKRHQFIERNMK